MSEESRVDREQFWRILLQDPNSVLQNFMKVAHVMQRVVLLSSGNTVNGIKTKDMYGAKDPIL